MSAQGAGADAIAAGSALSNGAADDLRAAALAELLGDIYTVQRSQKDLIALQQHLDTRLTGSVTALRSEIKRTQELLATRDSLVGELATRASEQARREFLRAATDAKVLLDVRSASTPMPAWQVVLATTGVLLGLVTCSYLALTVSRHFAL